MAKKHTLAKKRTVDTDDEFEEVWSRFEEKYHPKFSPFARDLILKHVKEMLGEK